MSEATFATRYRDEPDEALVALQESIGDLVPDAQAALTAEIERREIDVEALRAKAAVIDASIQSRKSAAFKRTLSFLAGMTLAVFTMGALGIQLGAIPYVAVLGASGFVAQWVIAMLQKRRAVPASR